MKIILILVLILIMFLLGVLFNTFIILKETNSKFSMIQFIKIFINSINFKCLYIIFIKNGEGLRSLIENSIENILDQNEYVTESQVRILNPRNIILRASSIIVDEIMNFYKDEQEYYTNLVKKDINIGTLKQKEVKSLGRINYSSFENFC